MLRDKKTWVAGQYQIRGKNSNIISSWFLILLLRLHYWFVNLISFYLYFMLFSIIKLFKHEIINQLGNFAFHRLLLFSINWKNETNRYYCCLKEFLLTSIKVKKKKGTIHFRSVFILWYGPQGSTHVISHYFTAWVKQNTIVVKLTKQVFELGFPKSEFLYVLWQISSW